MGKIRFQKNINQEETLSGYDLAEAINELEEKCVKKLLREIFKSKKQVLIKEFNIVKGKNYNMDCNTLVVEVEYDIVLGKKEGLKVDITTTNIIKAGKTANDMINSISNKNGKNDKNDDDKDYDDYFEENDNDEYDSLDDDDDKILDEIATTTSAATDLNAEKLELEQGMSKISDAIKDKLDKAWKNETTSIMQNEASFMQAELGRKIKAISKEDLEIRNCYIPETYNAAVFHCGNEFIWNNKVKMYELTKCRNTSIYGHDLKDVIVYG